MAGPSSNALVEFLTDNRYASVYCASMVLVASMVFYSLMGAYGDQNVPPYFDSSWGLNALALTFTLLHAFAVFAMIYSYRHSRALLQELSTPATDDFYSGLTLTPAQASSAIILGLAYCVFLNLSFFTDVLLLNSVNELLQIDSVRLALLIGNLLIWIGIALVLAFRIKVVRRFLLAGSRVEINLMERSNLQVFARAGIADVVIIAIASVINTLQSIGAQIRFENYLQALLVAIPAMVALAIMPMWSLHRRMKAEKTREIDNINEQIRQIPNDLEQENVLRLEALMQRRDRYTAAPTWPIDVAVLRSFFFYMIIPPLAWVGAAFVELAISAYIE